MLPTAVCFNIYSIFQTQSAEPALSLSNGDG